MFITHSCPVAAGFITIIEVGQNNRNKVNSHMLKVRAELKSTCADRVPVQIPKRVEAFTSLS